ncbi:MAG: bile acid:sodium symporter family protein [Bdellovibrionales bacterium]|nr:bile acid:sodium symporter family protein [Bdellovibrionales bacterium]
MTAAKFLPFGLALIMLGLGLTLTIEDFRRILRFPKPVLVGLFAQMFVLPAAAFGLCYLFGLSTEHSVGLMILAASPGGVLANLFSHLGHGDLALNVTLTAINSVLAAVTLPLMVAFALAHFEHSDQDIGLQYRKAIEVFTIVLVPVMIGMAVRRRNPALAIKADRPIRIFSVAVLFLIIVAAITQEWQRLLDCFSQLGGAMLAFNLLSLGVGYTIPRWLKLPKNQSVAIAMEIGLHNATLALYIGLSVLGNAAYALPSAIYSIVMFFTAAAFTALTGKSREVPV